MSFAAADGSAGRDDPELDRLRRLVARALPADVARSVVRIEPGSHGMFASELDAVADARDGRRDEFCSGRRAARRALAGLGLAAVPIPVGDSREPIWPEAVAGSITQSGGFCVAAAAWCGAHAAIGIDLEAAPAFDAAMIGVVCTPGELAAAREVGEDAAGRACLLFSIKEAFYKSAHARVRRFIDFLEVEVEFGSPESCSARLIGTEAAVGPDVPDVRARGSCVRDAPFVFSVLELATPAAETGPSLPRRSA